MSEHTLTIPGVARGKGRPKFGNGRTYTDSKTMNAEAWVKACAINQLGHLCLEGALAVSITIHVPVPASWSKSKREAALSGVARPTGRPDIDNNVKLAFDALNGILWKDDAQIVRLTASKVYGTHPETTLTVREA